MTGFRFQDPLWILLLAPLAVLGVLAILRQRRVAVLYSDVSILGTLPVTMALRAKRLLPWVRLLGLALVIVALARPQRGREEFRIRTEGIAIQMCIDRSGSMQATDFHLDGQQVDRLTAVKRVFRDFVAGEGRLPGRPDDLIGLVAFGGYAESKCPLTLDHGALVQVLDTVQMAELRQTLQDENLDRRMPKALQQQLRAALQEETLTAVGDAVALAVDRLQDVKAKSKVIILLSDGKSNAGAVDPVAAAEAAKTFGIKVYAVGIGSTGWARVPVQDRFGRTYFERTWVELDEEALQNLAQTTGGRYFNAKDTKALEQVYTEIDALEKTLSEGRL
ncbi:MAG: VWA domain-containing protein, partial [Planctomycetes bacterium]|nr:VWA domain-containing protein [Planctomycetota bacterium]